MGLFDFLKKKKDTNNIPPHIQNYDSIHPTETHLDEDSELPWGWFYYNKEFTDKIEKEFSYFLNCWINSQGKDVRTEYSALKSFIQCMKDVQKLCDSKGECFSMWCSEHLIGEEYLEKRQADLKYIEEHYDELLKQEKIKINIEQNLFPHLRTNLLKIIRDNPGILQTDIYKKFDSTIKEYVSSELYFMAKDGVIKREKAGRTYSLR